MTISINTDQKGEPIHFSIKSGGPVKNMIKIINQLQKANRPVIFTYDTNPSAASMMFLGMK